MAAPFTDAGAGEVLARVAMALVRRSYRAGNFAGRSPAQGVYYTARLVPDGMVQLHVALGGLAHYLSTRVGGSSDWLRHAVERSRYGLSFRHCVYVEYKARRADPRVTNRGVSSSSLERRRDSRTKRG